MTADVSHANAEASDIGEDRDRCRGQFPGAEGQWRGGGRRRQSGSASCATRRITGARLHDEHAAPSALGCRAARLDTRWVRAGGTVTMSHMDPNRTPPRAFATGEPQSRRCAARGRAALASRGRACSTRPLERLLEGVGPATARTAAGSVSATARRPARAPSLRPPRLRAPASGVRAGGRRGGDGRGRGALAAVCGRPAAAG